MDYFYDGQIRRYVTQFMRVFIGFKWKAGDGEQKTVPVLYGDLTRQVASIIKDNSENKMASVPRMACYISNLEMDTNRLSDATFISKVSVRERKYITDPTTGEREYQSIQGNNYTVERLMPTPFKLSMKCDIWTSSTDQKLQLLEQILILFNPSLELQTTDNYLDWTSLSVLNLNNITFSSRSIPQAESEIDICTLEFDMPIWITPPAKVKKLGIVQTVINNVFTDQGDIISLEDLIFNKRAGSFQTTTNRFGILLFKNMTDLSDYKYDVTIVNPNEAVMSLGLDQKEYKNGEGVDWNIILELQGGYIPGSLMRFKQSNGYDIVGTYTINPLDPTIMVVDFDPDTLPTNTLIPSTIVGVPARGTIDAIVDPYKFNPIKTYNGVANIPTGIRYLMLDDVNPNNANQDGPDAWKNLNGSDPEILTNSIIEWNGSAWVNLTTEWQVSVFPFTADVVYTEGQILRYGPVVFKALQNVTKVDNLIPIDANPDFFEEITLYAQNLKTGIQYRWAETQWLKSFEGEYSAINWSFDQDE